MVIYKKYSDGFMYIEVSVFILEDEVNKMVEWFIEDLIWC